MVTMGYKNTLSRLQEILLDCSKGNGRLALVEGGLASGKTHLLHEFTRSAAEGGALVLTATGSRAEQSLQLGIVDQLFRGIGPTPDLAEHPARLIGGDEDDGEQPAPGASHRALAGRIRELCGLLLEQCAAQPVVVAIDDIQFADAASLRMLLSLQHRIGGARLLILLSSWHRGKPTLPQFHAELTRHPCDLIQLAPLSQDDIGTLVGHRAAPGDPARFARRCHELTGGNPMLVHALLDDTLGAEAAPDTEEPRAPEQPVTGPAWSHAVLTCLYRWDDELLTVARAAALLGDRSSAALVSRLSDTRAEDAEELVGILSEAGILRGYVPRHPDAAAVILDTMPHAERATLHTRLARILHQRGTPAIEVARHLLAADEVPDQWAVEVLRDAGEQSLASGDSANAVRCLELAVGACTGGREYHNTTFALTRALRRANPAATTVFLPCLLSASESGELPAPAAVSVIGSALWHGNVEAATKVAAAITSAPGLDQPSAAELSATFHWYFGSDRRLNTAGAAGAAPSPRKGSWADAVSRLTTLWVRGGSEAATASAQHILRSCHVQDTAIEVVAIAIMALRCANKPEVARSWCERLIQQADHFGDKTWQAVLSGISADIALRLGDLSTAVRQAEYALELLPAKAWGVLIGQPRATLVTARTHLGDVDIAADILRQPVPDAMFETFAGIQYLEARGAYSLVTNRALAAGGDFQLCGRLLREWEVDIPALSPWRGNLAQVNLELGHTKEAAELIRQQLNLARPGDVRVRGISLRVLAATSELAQRPALLRQSVEYLTSAQDRIELARTLRDFSAVHQHLGEFDRARLLARRAAQVSRACLATVPAAPSEAERDGAGFGVGAGGAGVGAGGAGAGADTAEGGEGWSGPPAEQEPWRRQEGERMRQVLSEAERRVAELAALGHTNREISQTLFITVSTVEQHLTRIYRKLGITRRTDLLAVYELRGHGGDSRPDVRADVRPEKGHRPAGQLMSARSSGLAS